MIPSNSILWSSDLPKPENVVNPAQSLKHLIEPYFFAFLYVCDHVFICFVSRIDARFGALDRQREGIHDHDRVADNFSLHQTHDFVWNA